MLVMSRRLGETILIGDDIEIVIVQIGRSRVKVGIRAPRQTAVVAREVRLVREENRMAARAGGPEPPELIRSWLAQWRPGAQISAETADEGDVRQDAGTKNERISPCFPSKPT